MRRRFGLMTVAALATLALVGGIACDDDDNGDGDNEEQNEAAADLAGTFDNFKRDLAATENIEEAPDDVKDGLKDDCSTLQDEIDNEAIDEYCDDLTAAIDDEDQTEYARVKSEFAAVEAVFTQEVGDIVDEDDDDSDDEG